MFARFRKDPLIGNVLAVVAVFLALGAGAYAAGLAPNSVKSKHIVNGQVKNPDLAAASVTSAKIAAGAITSGLVPDDELVGADIDESSLAQVPSAASATNATNAGNAANAVNANLLDNKDSTAFQELGSEGWSNIDLNDAAGTIACNWTSFGGGYATPSYFRDRDGVVHLRGLVKANDGVGGGSTVCGGIPTFDPLIGLVGALPAGYTPENRSLFTISSNNKPGRVDIFANGSILLGDGLTVIPPTYPSYADAKVWLSLDGIRYRCGPSGSNGCP